MNTGHKAWDRKADKCGVYKGNALTSAQYSSFIRAHQQTECNGFIREPGHLRQFDINAFGAYRIPSAMRKKMDEHKDEQVILYCIRYWKGDKCSVLGWVLTDEHYYPLATQAVIRTSKTWNVIDAFLQRVTEKI